MKSVRFTKPAAGVVKTSCVATPGSSDNDWLAEVKPEELNVRVRVPEAPANERPLKVARPELAFSEAVPEMVPESAATSMVADEVVKRLLPESRTSMTGWVFQTAPLAAPAAGVMIASLVAAPTARVKDADLVSVRLSAVTTVAVNVLVPAVPTGVIPSPVKMTRPEPATADLVSLFAGVRLARSLLDSTAVAVASAPDKIGFASWSTNSTRSPLSQATPLVWVEVSIHTLMSKIGPWITESD